MRNGILIAVISILMPFLAHAEDGTSRGEATARDFKEARIVLSDASQKTLFYTNSDSLEKGLQTLQEKFMAPMEQAKQQLQAWPKNESEALREVLSAEYNRVVGAANTVKIFARKYNLEDDTLEVRRIRISLYSADHPLAPESFE